MKTKPKATKTTDSAFQFHNKVLHVDGVSLADVAAEFSTPAYVYSRQQIVNAYTQYDSAFPTTNHLVCYSVKANPARAILETFASLGAGFDIVSGGELARVLQAGGDAERIIFSGVGKMDDELDAALAAGIRCFNIESASELNRLDQLARKQNRKAPIAFRVNPGIATDTHPHIATGGSDHKFGIPRSQIPGLAAAAASLSSVSLQGLAMHIGSQMTDLEPLVVAATDLRELAGELRASGIGLKHLDLGGGLGVGDQAPARQDYVAALTGVFGKEDSYEIVIEPGRSLVAASGVLLTRVLQIKHSDAKSFVIVDSGMNDLLRPALYGAHHDIVNVDSSGKPPVGTYDVVGPICETADTLGSGRRLAVREGSVLAIMDTGAYGATMSSHYNSRPRCAEIMIDNGVARLSRQRETIDELSRKEKFMTQKKQ
ncbi:MAG: diaminopimelate decarboxylase [Gammaproteobacteria bacterium]|nr:diaminopimelate decarboxylase [Gammaproteobacteria bacterium]MDH3767132.1 diaminopimelate decarboxylase [Gammaproteobacteria bacterium]